MKNSPASLPERLSARVLLVEDDEAFRISMARSLELADYNVHTVDSAEAAALWLAHTLPDVVVSDLRLPQSDGLYVLSMAKQRDADLPVVLMTGHGDIPTAIQAIRDGAYDFLEKPFSRDRLLAIVGRATQQYRLTVENRRLKNRIAAASGIDQVLLGDSKAVRDLRDLILRLAPTPADVLIHGETGTGKELVARCLHDYGGRSGHFVAVNCAAIPEALFESELFGHEAGAFTGATRQRIGKIEHAKDGTLFLDEIEAMPLNLQAKVLRVLQEREIERLGSNKAVPVSFRVVAATKVSLDEASRNGSFRADLYYRLNVAALRLPALRERLDDVLTLFGTFLQQTSLRYQLPTPVLTPAERQALLSYRWPGNVRELRSGAERKLLGMPIFVDEADETRVTVTLEQQVALLERSLLEEALRRHGGSVRAACSELSVTSATMYRKLKALGIDASHFKADAADSGEA
jgi:DNA-binding NtrC family response regulator